MRLHLHQLASKKAFYKAFLEAFYGESGPTHLPHRTNSWPEAAGGFGLAACFTSTLAAGFTSTLAACFTSTFSGGLGEGGATGATAGAVGMVGTDTMEAAFAGESVLTRDAAREA